MLFKKNIKQIILYSNEGVLYDGPLDELPIKEEVILEKSIFYYDDPNPCYIHRSAVHLRLISEIEDQLSEGCLPASKCPLIGEYTGFKNIVQIKYALLKGHK